MGLFDRLFGKKDKEEHQDTPVNSTDSQEELTNTEGDNSDHLEAVQEVDTESSLDQHEPVADDYTALQDSQMAEVVEPTAASDSRLRQEDSGSETVAKHSEEMTDKSSLQKDNSSSKDETSETAQNQNSVSEVVSEESAHSTSVSSERAQTSSSNDPRFESLMADYYAKKAAVAEAAEHGETLTFEAMSTRQVETTSQETVSSEKDSVETTEEKYNRSLKKTRTGFAARLNEFFANFRTVDEEFFEELEELLIVSDVGVTVATHLTEALRYEARLKNAKKPDNLKHVIIEKLVDIYEKDDVYNEQIKFQNGLTVMLFVGVNGVGKTTSIGKLAYQYQQQGKKVMLVAADTFRAGAVAQLVEWGRRVAVPVVTGAEKADPASVVFDGMERAVAEGVDVLMIDTAGRLQNKDNLMKELEKIGRIIKRVVPEAPHETLLALDASTGQNALSQAKEFSKITPLTGIVLTKIDGTAKGGVVLAIRQELDIPVKLIGFGEKIDDIGPFNSENFMQGLLEGLI